MFLSYLCRFIVGMLLSENNVIVSYFTQKQRKEISRTKLTIAALHFVSGHRTNAEKAKFKWCAIKQLYKDEILSVVLAIAHLNIILYAIVIY